MGSVECSILSLGRTAFRKALVSVVTIYYVASSRKMDKDAEISNIADYTVNACWNIDHQKRVCGNTDQQKIYLKSNII